MNREGMPQGPEREPQRPAAADRYAEEVAILRGRLEARDRLIDQQQRTIRELLAMFGKPSARGA